MKGWEQHLCEKERILMAAGAAYEPRPLGLIPGWCVGFTESQLPSHRRELRHFWEKIKACGWSSEAITIDWYMGLKLKLSFDSEISRCIYVEGVFEPNEFCFLKRVIKPGMIFFDIGANIGLYALFASRLVGSDGFVYAFEPSSREFARLQENLSINEIVNVKAMKIAIAEKNTSRELFVADDWHGGHNTFARQFPYEATSLKAKEVVTTRALDEIVKEEAIQRVDIVKIDVEGAEHLVLEGARRTLERFRPTLLIELNDTALRNQGSSSQKICQLLDALSYALYRFDGHTGMPVRTRNWDFPGSENVIACPVQIAALQ